MYLYHLVPLFALIYDLSLHMLELWPRGLPKMHEALVARLAWTWPVELDILLLAGASPGSVQMCATILNRVF